MLFASYARAQAWMHPNEGQWDDRIEYKVEMQVGEMLIEKDGFTYFLNDASQTLRGEHDHHGDHEALEDEDKFRAHVIQTKFLGSSWTGEAVPLESSSFYRNYFLGSDQSTWKSKIYSHSLLELTDYYDGIDLILDGRFDRLKYSLRVEAGIDPQQIQLNYIGADGLTIDDEGNLRIANRFGEIIEGRPIAWTLNEETGKKTELYVVFALDGDQVHFEFPDGYNETETLIIDPDITFSTFTGSTADNWGMTATPDSDGNLFGGGVVFGLGYPIVAGSYDASFNGGSIDLGITKFSSNGTALLYSTFIGGNGSETPHSMICAPNGELYIFGITSSSNFPMAGTPYDNTFAGGPSMTTFSNGLGFSQGSDIYIARLSADGGSMLSSTYIGGLDTDGLNAGPLQHNYGDQFRGEIILDDAGNVYVASTTRSSDFPTVQGSQGSIGGSQDAVIFKMSGNLSNLIWSTFFGGVSEETGNSLQVNSLGDVYFVGGTRSQGLPFNGFSQSLSGGTDGYLAKLNGTNGTLQAGTYIGNPEYDQTYFVQLDLDDSVYIYGQTEQGWAITPGHYGNANSGQFIQKFNGDLTSMLWTTLIGAGTGHVEISPTAFLVSDCYDIYLSGWGGELNVQYASAIYSTTTGFPVTSSAYQPTTGGSNFYIAVLNRDAGYLKYGTFMGGAANVNHVDGGTSRFDKSGRIYHAVCAACGVNNFSTTSDAWSTSNGSSNCNMACFKFELSTIDAIISTPQTVICIPDPAVFDNNSSNGNAFYWDFGDNTSSTDENPTHLYTSPGTYDVTLIVIDTNNCYTSDTVLFSIYIGDFQGSVIQPPGPVCPGTPYQMEALGGVNYLWSPANVLDDPTIANPIATVDVTTDFMVIISDTCGVDTVYVTLPVYSGVHTIIEDQSICIGNSVDLFATGGSQYLWSPPDYLDDPTSATPLCTPDITTEYFVEITTSDGCTMEDTVLVEVYYTPPIPVMPDSISICVGESVLINVSGGVTYLWSPNSNITSITDPSVTVSPTDDMYYYCDFTNPCGTVPDSVYIDIIIPEIIAGNDTIICPGESATLWASGGISYYWTPASVNPNNASQVTATPSQPTVYTVVGFDQFGCSNSATVFVDLYPMAFIQTSPDVYAFYGDEIELSATSTTSGTYIWYPSEFLSCVACENPIATPNQNYWYTVSYTDENGCSSSDTVHIYYDPILYVPNTFTPNSEDDINWIFKAEGGNMRTFHMDIYDRWGELIFTGESIDEGWDGTYLGADCQDGTYVWKISLTDFYDKEHKHVGHVNLLR